MQAALRGHFSYIKGSWKCCLFFQKPHFSELEVCICPGALLQATLREAMPKIFEEEFCATFLLCQFVLRLPLSTLLAFTVVTSHCFAPPNVTTPLCGPFVEEYSPRGGTRGPFYLIGDVVAYTNHPRRRLHLHPQAAEQAVSLVTGFAIIWHPQGGTGGFSEDPLLCRDPALSILQ